MATVMSRRDFSIAPDSELQMELNLRGGAILGAAVSERAADELPSESKSHVHPKSTPDWTNLKVIHRNTLPPRSYFFVYWNDQDALNRDISRSMSLMLSGTWKFHLSKAPFDGPTDFYQRGFDTSNWENIKVPGMWQCQGFGRGPQYTNLDFPFPADPPFVPIDDNECGRYVTTFHVKDWAVNHQLRLRFEGVDAAFTVWVNGHDVGYSQGSRNPSEFDVTQYVEIGCDNTLAVEVYQRCDGSYLEDQVRSSVAPPYLCTPDSGSISGRSLRED
jgi:beta-galactosidase